MNIYTESGTDSDALLWLITSDSYYVLTNVKNHWWLVVRERLSRSRAEVPKGGSTGRNGCLFTARAYSWVLSRLLEFVRTKQTLRGFAQLLVTGLIGVSDDGPAICSSRVFPDIMYRVGASSKQRSLSSLLLLRTGRKVGS